MIPESTTSLEWASLPVRDSELFFYTCLYPSSSLYWMHAAFPLPWSPAGNPGLLDTILVPPASLASGRSRWVKVLTIGIAATLARTVNAFSANYKPNRNVMSVHSTLSHFMSLLWVNGHYWRRHFASSFAIDVPAPCATPKSHLWHRPPPGLIELISTATSLLNPLGHSASTSVCKLKIHRFQWVYTSLHCSQLPRNLYGLVTQL